MIKAVVFDFDGLIIDTETAWYEAFQEVMAGYSVELPLEQFARCIGTDDTVLYEYFREHLGEIMNEDEVRLKADKIYKEKMKTPLVREGVKEYLEEAKELGLKIALASSSSRKWVTGYLRDLGLYDYFEVIQTRDDVEKVKPDPALYEKAIEALQVKPSKAIAFEDSVNGAKAAIAAGLNCVVVPNPVTKSLAFEMHHLRICSMGEKSLRDVVKQIEQK